MLAVGDLGSGLQARVAFTSLISYSYASLTQQTPQVQSEHERIINDLQNVFTLPANQLNYIGNKP